jgi:DNA-binding MarR family transcriptional regulator
MLAHCEKRGKPYVITPPQWGALTLLLAQDGLTIGTMSQKRGVDASTGTGIITRLEQMGLVERHHNREDRRVVKVFLTDEGRDISHTMASSVEHFEQILKRGFSEGELDRFLAQLQQIITNVSEIGPGWTIATVCCQILECVETRPRRGNFSPPSLNVVKGKKET